MKNKCIEINNLLSQISRESLRNYIVVDFWESDLTAVGLKIDNNLIYVSAFNYDKTSKYHIVIEEYDSSRLIKEERESSYDELLELISRM